MSSDMVSVRKWKLKNENKLVDCRWKCSMSLDACKKYQSRANRHIIHFNGSRNPLTRVNAEYIKCLSPEPCPHLLDEDELDQSFDRWSYGGTPTSRERSRRFNRAAEWDEYVNPDYMLEEDDTQRSLTLQ